MKYQYHEVYGNERMSVAHLNALGEQRWKLIDFKIFSDVIAKGHYYYLFIREHM